MSTNIAVCMLAKHYYVCISWQMKEIIDNPPQHVQYMQRRCMCSSNHSSAKCKSEIEGKQIIEDEETSHPHWIQKSALNRDLGSTTSYSRDVTRTLMHDYSLRALYVPRQQMTSSSESLWFIKDLLFSDFAIEK